MAFEIWEKIKETIDKFDEDKIDINPSFARRQKDIVNLIDYYWLSKYQGGVLDATGFRKSFYNIVINPVEIASKMIDLDTKDIRFIAEEGQSYYPAWLMGKEFKNWIKDKKNQDRKTFGQFLNQ